MGPVASAAVPRRSYRSPVRERRARETRERILAAASRELVRRGYAATTMRIVAEAAQVSVASVELAFATKAELLRATISFAIRGDDDNVPMLERSWALEAQRAASAENLLGIVGRVLVDAEQRSAGLVVAAFEAARADASLSGLADRLRAQRAETATWIVEALLRHGRLRRGVAYAEAVDTVWLLMDPHGYLALTRDRGWAPARFRAWFGETVSRLLLAEEGGPSTTTVHPPPPPATPPTRIPKPHVHPRRTHRRTP